MAGEVKTRLMPALSAGECARLQRDLVQRVLSTAICAALSEVDLWCAPGCSHPFFAECAGAFNVELHAQQGKDLGARMHRALADTLTHAEFALIIGCDCPALDAIYLTRACEVLADGVPAVLGPAEDGGYILIGARRDARELFEGIDWGTPRVLTQTRTRLRVLGWTWRELEALWDVDRPEDLTRLQNGVIPRQKNLKPT